MIQQILRRVGRTPQGLTVDPGTESSLHCKL